MLSKEQAEHVRKQVLEQLEKLPEDQVSSLKKQVKEASPEELEAFMQQMQSQQQVQGECIFCKIIKKEIETIKIFEDKEILCILDIAPASKGHVIVMPKQHIQFIQEVSNDLLNKLMNFTKLLAPVLVQTMNAEALSIYIPQGNLAGQNVGHFFINIIPRYDKDKINIAWEKKQENKKELQKIAEKIKKAASSKVVQQLEHEKARLLKYAKAKEQSEAEKIYKHVKKRRV